MCRHPSRFSVSGLVFDISSKVTSAFTKPLRQDSGALWAVVGDPKQSNIEPKQRCTFFHFKMYIANPCSVLSNGSIILYGVEKGSNRNTHIEEI